jgi:hypothetical protein
MPFFPDQLTKLGIETEIKQLMEEIDGILKENGLPICPMCLAFPCFMILTCILQSKMRSSVLEAAAKFNETVGKKRS